MGSFVFRWPREATEVFVTGTFDDWGKTVQLEKKGSYFEKEVHLPSIDGKIQYKFVVDGAWVTDSDARQENDGHNNINNVLLPEDLKTVTKTPTTEFEHLTGGNTSAAVMAGVVPEATTAQLAGEVPREQSSSVPGQFPETPANELNELSINPIPATNGIGNPVKLNPGEPVPHHSTLHNNTVESTVRTDKEGYEADASNPFVGSNKAESQIVDPLAVPPVSEKGLIPESSLPMNPPQTSEPGYTIQSAHPTSTTAALAGQVPLESQKNAQTASDVPEVVKESISKAHQDPEAAANAEAVEEKAEVERELQNRVGAVDSSAAAPAADVPSIVKDSLQQAHQDPEAAASAAAVEEKAEVEKELQNKVGVVGGSAGAAAPAADVPSIVKDSLQQAHQDPEAAASEAAVEEKREVEQELQQKVATTEEAGEPAPTATAATTETAPVAATAAAGSTDTGKRVESSQVSPQTTSPPATAGGPSTTTQSQPTVTTGVASGTTTEESKPVAGTTQDNSKEKKKKNRASGFFQKLKERLK